MIGCRFCEYEKTCPDANTPVSQYCGKCYEDTEQFRELSELYNSLINEAQQRLGDTDNGHTDIEETHSERTV